MSLENLLKIGQLKSHPFDRDEVDRLLAAAERNLRDANVTSISPENRFDAAYKVITQSALAALMVRGYRPDTNRPGHHMTLVQGLALTVNLETKRVVMIDALCRQRNASDYTGNVVDRSTAEHCIVVAAELMSHVIASTLPGPLARQAMRQGSRWHAVHATT